jgi:diguanylate cyclase (GGDEF)-like protein
MLRDTGNSSQTLERFSGAVSMRLIDRHDGLLAAGLMFTAMVVFQPSIHYVLDLARQVEATYNVELIPAFLILSVMFVFHQQGKRRETGALAAAATHEAAQVRERMAELERLGAFGQALARTLTSDALREVVARHAAEFLEGAEGWILLTMNGRWDVLIDTRGDTRPERLTTLERLAEDTLKQAPGALSEPGWTTREGYVCLPMVVAGTPVGVLGVLERHDAGADRRRRVLSAAAALLAITVRNVQLFLEIRDNSIRDPLTGCFSRGHGLELVETELQRGRRSGVPPSMLMVDIDRFKEINDHHGHLSGDNVLAAIGRQVRNVLRSTDITCRYGGDEFLILLSETSVEGASHVAEWLRQEIANVAVVSNGGRVPVSASIGVTTASVGELDVRTLIKRADEALYSAKRDGRDCVRALVVPEAGDRAQGVASHKINAA